MTDRAVPHAPQPRPPSHLFTVRVWLYECQDGEAEWRGKVQHVASGDAHYFRDWPTLLTYIQQMLADRLSRENVEADFSVDVIRDP